MPEQSPKDDGSVSTTLEKINLLMQSWVSNLCTILLWTKWKVKPHGAQAISKTMRNVSKRQSFPVTEHSTTPSSVEVITGVNIKNLPKRQRALVTHMLRRMVSESPRGHLAAPQQGTPNTGPWTPLLTSFCRSRTDTILCFIKFWSLNKSLFGEGVVLLKRILKPLVWNVWIGSRSIKISI